MHFANGHATASIDHLSIAASKSPLPSKPPQLYQSANSGSSPVYIRVSHASPAELPSPVSSRPHPHRGSPSEGRHSASHNSPRLRRRSASIISPLLSPETPSQPLSLAAHNPSASPPRGVVMASASLSPQNHGTPASESANKPWLLDAKSLQRPRGPTPPPGVPQDLQSEAVKQKATEHIRAFLSSPSTTIPSLQASLVASAHKLQPTVPAIASSPTASVLTPSSPPATPGAHEPTLNSQVARQLGFAEQHHRESLVEDLVATMQELRLDFMLQRNTAQQLQHSRNERRSHVLASSPSSHPSRPVVAMHSPQFEARVEHRTGPSNALANTNAINSWLEASPPLAPGTPLREAAVSTTPQENRQKLFGSASKALMLRASPGTLASANAFAALNHVLQEEERSLRTLLEATSTNACVILRQVLQCWIRGLHPASLFVQEQHHFGMIRAAFEEEHAQCGERHQRWVWEQHAERVQYWSRRVSVLRTDEDRDRDALTHRERESWNDLARRADTYRRILVSEAAEESARREAKWRRSLAAIQALESSTRDQLVIDQTQLRAELRHVEDDAFRMLIANTLCNGSCTTDEVVARDAQLEQEMLQRRELEQMFSWSRPPQPSAMSAPRQVAPPAVEAAPHTSPLSDPFILTSVPSHGSLDDSGYFEANGDDDRNGLQGHHVFPAKRRHNKSPSARRRATPPGTFENFMRPTISSAVRQLNERSVSQDTAAAAATTAAPPSAGMQYDTAASSIRNAPSSMLSDTEPSSRIDAPQRTPVSPRRMQRTVDRLAQPKHRAHHVESDDAGPYMLSFSSAASLPSAGPLTGPPPVRAARYGRDEPMSIPQPKVLTGNSVMILRGDRPRPQSQPRATSAKRAPQAAPEWNSNTQRSSTRRYVDTFYNTNKSDGSTAVRSKGTTKGQPRHLDASASAAAPSPISASNVTGTSLASDSAQSHLPPTGKQQRQQRQGHTDPSQRKLSKWEAATLLMYDKHRSGGS